MQKFTRYIEKKRAWCTYKLVLLLFLSFFFSFSLSSYAAPSSKEDFQNINGVLVIPKRVGLAMTGEKYESDKIKIDFVRPIRRVSLLTKNGFKLSKVILSFYNQKQIKGVFTFQDKYKRNVIQDFEIHYKSVNPKHFRVLKAISKQIEPLALEIEAYFLPSEKINKNKIKQMDIRQLLNFARKASDQATLEVQNASVKSYEVLIFCMDRLLSGSQLKLISRNANSDSWSRNRWHVAWLSSTFAINGSVEELFYVYHKRGKGPIDPGKVYMAGVFSNQYLPPVPTGPNLSREIPQEIRAIKAKYASKAFHSLKN